MDYASFYGQAQRPPRTVSSGNLNLPYTQLFSAGPGSLGQRFAAGMRRVAGGNTNPGVAPPGTFPPVGDTGPGSFWRRYQRQQQQPVDETGYLPRTGNERVNALLAAGGRLWNPFADQQRASYGNPMASLFGGFTPAPFDQSAMAPYVPQQLGSFGGQRPITDGGAMLRGGAPQQTDVNSPYFPRRFYTTDV